MSEDEKLKALREAWLDVPFCGVVEAGTGAWLQPLINAVSEIVDPDRTLRETPEAQLRGKRASYRSRYAFMTEQINRCVKLGVSAAEWEAKRDEIAHECQLDLCEDPW